MPSAPPGPTQPPPHLLPPQVRLAGAPAAEAEENGPACRIQGITHPFIRLLHRHCCLLHAAVVVLEEIHTPFGIRGCILHAHGNER